MFVTFPTYFVVVVVVVVVDGHIINFHSNEEYYCSEIGHSS